MTDTETGYTDDCCWNYIRHYCKGAGCACRCHEGDLERRPAHGEAPRMSEIGDAIRAQRKASGLTALALAERLRISPQFVNDIEYGRRLPTPDRVLQFANQWPDVDSAAWLWLLLTDLWGEPIAATMHAWAVHTCRATARQEAGQ